MRKYILFFLMFILLITGCQKEQLQNSKQTEAYNKNELAVANSGAEGISLGLYNENNTIVKERTFKINEDLFKKNLVLGNKTSKQQEFVILLFDHGKQINFKIDGQKTNHHVFQTPAGEYSSINIEAINLEDGFHSLSYLILRSPSKKFNTPEEAQLYSQVYSVRVNILKNIDNIPTKRTDLTKPNYDIENESRVSGVLLGENENKYMPKLINDKNSFEYNLVYGNQWDKEVDFYIVSLLNWEQIRVDSDNLFIYDKLKPSQEKTIHSSIQKEQLNDEENILVSFFLPSPYKNLNSESPFVDAEITSSNRIYIH